MTCKLLLLLQFLLKTGDHLFKLGIEFLLIFITLFFSCFSLFGKCGGNLHGHRELIEVILSAHGDLISEPVEGRDLEGRLAHFSFLRGISGEDILDLGIGKGTLHARDLGLIELLRFGGASEGEIAIFIVSLQFLVVVFRFRIDLDGGCAGEERVARRRAVLVDPRRIEAWLARCDLFLAQEGLAATAERLAREGAAAVGEAAAAPLLFRRALALGTLGRLDDARTLYEACHRLRPHDAQIRAGLAAVLASIGVRDLFTASPDALERLGQRIAELDPTNPQGQLIRAVALRGRKQIADALILLEQVRPVLAGDAEVEQLYAETLRDRAWQLWFDESTRAASWPLFRRFVDEAPARVDTEAVRNLLEQEWQRRLSAGQTALIEKDPARAERALRDCLQLRPEDSAPNLQLGMALLLRDSKLATSEEALRCFELAGEGQRRAGRDMGLAILYQATALMRLGRLDEARRRADAYLASPVVTADAAIAARIRELLDG